MRALLATASFCLFVGAVPASELPPAGQRLDARLEDTRSLQAWFVQTREVGLTGEVLEASGWLAFRRPHDFRLVYTGDDPQEVAVTGDSLWVYSPLEAQAILYPFDPFAPGGEVMLLFGARGRSLTEVFHLTQEPWEGFDHALRLEPKHPDPGYPFVDMRLVVDEVGFPSIFYYAEATGDRVTLRFTRVRGNPAGIASALAFSMPDTVEVLDARDLDSR